MIVFGRPRPLFSLQRGVIPSSEKLEPMMAYGTPWKERRKCLIRAPDTR